MTAELFDHPTDSNDTVSLGDPQRRILGAFALGSELDAFGGDTTRGRWAFGFGGTRNLVNGRVIGYCQACSHGWDPAFGGNPSDFITVTFTGEDYYETLNNDDAGLDNPKQTVSGFQGPEDIDVGEDCDSWSTDVDAGTGGPANSEFSSLLLSGEGMQTKIGTFTHSSSSSDSVTGLGFQPRLIVLMAFFDDGQDDMRQSYGACDENLNQFSIATHHAGATAPFGPQRASRMNSGVVAELINGLGVVRSYEITSMDADGFSYDVTNTSATTIFFKYIAFGGDTQNEFFVGTAQQPAGSGVQSITAPGFQPNALLTMSAQLAALGSSDTAQTAHVFGMVDAAGLARAAGGGAPLSAGAKGASRWDDKAVDFVDLATGGSLANADFDGYTANGFDLDWTSDGVTRHYGYVALRLPGYDPCVVEFPAKTVSMNWRSSDRNASTKRVLVGG